MPGYYETDRAVAEYLLFHYGSAAEVMPWTGGPHDGFDFPGRCVELLVAAIEPAPRQRALDLGCAVGRASFELARHCAEVVGIDASNRFIEAARRLQESGAIEYAVVSEGDLANAGCARVPAGIDRQRVRFETGDALSLRGDLGVFDLVLAANLIDRVGHPGRLLSRFGGLVRQGGCLLVTSPYTWLDEYTPRSEWLCRDGTATVETLARFLPEFRLVKRADLPFVIREHARKFQWSVAEATVWRRE